MASKINVFIHADILVLVSEFNGGYFIVSVCHFRLIPQLGMFAIDFLTEHACIYIYIYIYIYICVRDIVSSCSVGLSDGTAGNSTQTTDTMVATQQGTSGHPPTATAASSTPSSASQGSSEADKKQSTTILSSKCAKVKTVCIVYSRSLIGK